jgi:hypothetical protein
MGFARKMVGRIPEKVISDKRKVKNRGTTFHFSFITYHLREDVKNNLPILIGFYPILNANALSGLWFQIEGTIAFVVKYYHKTLKGL